MKTTTNLQATLDSSAPVMIIDEMSAVESGITSDNASQVVPDEAPHTDLSLALQKSDRDEEPVDPNYLEDMKARILFYKEQSEHSFIEMGRSLLEVKSKLAHGEFLPWLRANIGVHPRTAQCYMSLAEEFSNGSPVSCLGYTKAKIVLALPPAERAAFVDELHVVNGVTKRTPDLSKRQLEKIVRERVGIGTRAPNATPKRHELSSFPRISRTQRKALADDPFDPVKKFTNGLEHLECCIDGMLNHLTTLDDQGILNELSVALHDLCVQTMQRIASTAPELSHEVSDSNAEVKAS